MSNDDASANSIMLTGLFKELIAKLFFAGGGGGLLLGFFYVVGFF